MVIDKHQGHNIPRYLAYDIIKCDGIDISKMKFPMRLKVIEVSKNYHSKFRFKKQNWVINYYLGETFICLNEE